MSNNKSDGEFVDPLGNYDPKTYADSLEQAICEDSAMQVQHEPFTSISPETSVAAAVNKLAADHVSCLLVEDEGKLVGLFTDREVLDKVALEEDALNRPVRDVMTKEPVFVREDDPIASTLCVMAVHGYRHVPILDINEKVVGIVSPQRVTAYLKKCFAD